MRLQMTCLLLYLSAYPLSAATLGNQGIRTISYGQTTQVQVQVATEPWSKTALSSIPYSPQITVPFLSRATFRAMKNLSNERARIHRAAKVEKIPLVQSAPLASDFTSSFDGPGESDGGEFPPDDAIAAGPNDLLVAINALVGIYDKSGNQIGSLQPMSSFFSSLGLTGSYSDPRVLYDATAGRYIVVDDLVGIGFCLISCTVTDSHILVAVSQTSDPTGSWTKYAFNTWGLDPTTTANTWADYPAVGLNASELYVATDQYDSCDLFNSSSCVFSDAWVSVISLTDLYSGSSSPTVTTFKNVTTATGELASAIEPALIVGGISAQEPLAAAYFPSDPSATTSSVLNLFSISMSGTPSLTAVDLKVPPYSMPPNASQPGTSVPIETNDFRLINAVWANGVLWCAQNIADDKGTSAIIRWYKISLTSLSAPALQDSGTITGSGNAYFPAVMLDANNQVSVVFGTSSASQYPSAAYTGRAGSDPVTTMRAPIIYSPGLATYTYSVTDSNGNPVYRWGDYSGIALDNGTGTTWGIAEYSKGPDPNYVNAVVGIVSPPSLEVTPDPLQFTDELQGASETSVLTLTNAGSSSVLLGTMDISGPDSGSFSTKTDGCSGNTLPASAQCSVNIAFSPATSGAKDAQLEIPQTIGGISQGMIAVHLFGNSISNAKVTLSASALTFSDQAVGTTSNSQSVTLTNTGTGPLGVATIGTIGDFSETNNCGATVSAGSSCSISVVFAPKSSGTLSGALTVTDDAPGSPHQVTLSGTAVAPQISVDPAALDFGQQPVGVTSSAKNVTVSNTGAVSLAITQIVTTTWQFGEQSNCPFSPSTLPAGSSCNVSVTFAPSSRGSLSASLQITDNAPNSPQTVTLTGQGIQPGVSLSTTTLSFGSQNVGTTSAGQTVTLTNTGQDVLSVTSIAIVGSNPGDFAESDNCMGTLASMASCNIAVTFSPAAPANRTASLSIADNASGSPQTITLYGTGTSPAVTVSPQAVGFGNSNVGTTGSIQTVNIWNSGNTALSISAIGIIGANNTDFALVAANTSCSTTAQLNPGSSCNIAVTFTPTQLGSRSAALSITDNAPGSPHVVPLTGTGQDFALTVASGNSQSATINAGGSANYELAVSPEDGFNQYIAFACSGAPSKAQCTVSPTSITLNGVNATEVKITVTTTAPETVALLGSPGSSTRSPGFGFGFAAIIFLGIPPIWTMYRQRRERRWWAVFILAVLIGSGSLTSCGGGRSQPVSPGTPAGTYTLTVTATSGKLVHSAILSLTVN